MKPRAAIQADPDNDPDPGRRGQVFMQREEVGGREEKPSKKDCPEKRVGDHLKRLKMPEVLQTAGQAKVN